MALRMLSISCVLALALACGSSPLNPPPAPTPTETPPKTKDPGTVVDERPLQPSVPPEPEGGSADQRSQEPAGAPCLVGGECASGICEGEGCSEDRPGVCAAQTRPCTKDLRQYCGCDGKTFGASGTCPGRRFAARARCGS